MSASAITRFFQTPKGLLTMILAALIAMAAPGQGGRYVATGLGSSVLAAGLADAIILRMRKGRWEYPSGAVLSAAIVVMVPPEIATLFAPTVGVTRMPLAAIVLVPVRVTAAATEALNRRVLVVEPADGAGP